MKNKSNNCFLLIEAGADHPESYDWVSILFKMYTNYINDNLPWNYKIISKKEDKIMLKVSGKNTFEYLSTEAGIHRLVRVSPFDKQGRRHTSFASVVCSDKKIDEDLDTKWSEQIRSYVLQPYTLITDHRTGYKTKNVQDVLDGKINDFIKKELTRIIKEKLNI